MAPNERCSECQAAEPIESQTKRSSHNNSDTCISQSYHESEDTILQQNQQCEVCVTCSAHQTDQMFPEDTGNVIYTESNIPARTRSLRSPDSSKCNINTANLHLQLSADTNIKSDAGVKVSKALDFTHLQEACCDNLNIKCDADVKVSEAFDFTNVLEACCDKGVESLSESTSDVDCGNRHSVAALMAACETGGVDVVRALIEKGADVHATELPEAKTALHCASGYGHEAIVTLLIDSGADVNAKSTNNATPLHFASHMGSLEVTKLLLDCGADVNATTTKNVTPLHLASEYGHDDVTRLLIRHGADVKAKTNTLDTALHMACFYGRVSVVTELLKEGAEVFDQNLRGWSCVLCARINGHVAVVNLLIHAMTKCAYMTCMKATARLRHFARAPAC